MDKRYAIFDMDGTLVDSMGWWDRAAEEYLASRGVAEVPQALLQRTVAMTMLDTMRLFIDTYGLSDTPEQAVAAAKAVMDGHYRHDIGLKPGAAAYLARLRARGVRMCVASATPEPLMELCLERLGVRDMFAFVLSCDSVGAGKDRPDVYDAAAKRLGAPSAGDTAVYEDAVAAARTAKAAGYYLVGVYDDSGADRWAELTALADETIRAWE